MALYKRDQWVICVKERNYLTAGKRYKVARDSVRIDGDVYVTDDTGRVRGFFNSRFKPASAPRDLRLVL